MSKLSLDALKERAEAIASEELMASINGGTENSCHNGTPSTPAVTAPTTPKVSYEVNVDVKYDSKTGGTTVGAGIKIKF
jgi:hypothetical protein